MKNKNKRRISILVTAQTAYNLRRLADLAGYHEPGMVVDKLVRDRLKLIRPSMGRHDGYNPAIVIADELEPQPGILPQNPEFRTKYLGKWFFKNGGQGEEGG